MEKRCTNLATFYLYIKYCTFELPFKAHTFPRIRTGDGIFLPHYGYVRRKPDEPVAGLGKDAPLERHLAPF